MSRYRECNKDRPRHHSPRSTAASRGELDSSVHARVLCRRMDRPVASSEGEHSYGLATAWTRGAKPTKAERSWRPRRSRLGERVCKCLAWRRGTTHRRSMCIHRNQGTCTFSSSTLNVFAPRVPQSCRRAGPSRVGPPPPPAPSSDAGRLKQTPPARAALTLKNELAAQATCLSLTGNPFLLISRTTCNSVHHHKHVASVRSVRCSPLSLRPIPAARHLARAPARPPRHPAGRLPISRPRTPDLPDTVSLARA